MVLKHPEEYFRLIFVRTFEQKACSDFDIQAGFFCQRCELTKVTN
jgi:hypothetical protein